LRGRIEARIRVEVEGILWRVVGELRVGGEIGVEEIVGLRMGLSRAGQIAVVWKDWGDCRDGAGGGYGRLEGGALVLSGRGWLMGQSEGGEACLDIGVELVICAVGIFGDAFRARLARIAGEAGQGALVAWRLLTDRGTFATLGRRREAGSGGGG
jgi:hypothetical protein